VNWGRQRGIPAIARGSGVGTMTGYVLGLSNACPVHYGLLFERFTDPDRAEYPDIDIDLCQNGRGEVINYVREKYGHVAQIITFGTLKARAALRDVCRVHQIPLAEADRLAKLVPEQLNITLDQALKAEPDLKKEYENNSSIRAVIDNARVLEGQARHASVHAAGVIVATVPLDTVVPLYKQSGSEDVITQWDGPTCEKMGLLKMDFLGLRTLSVVERCKQLIGESLDEAGVWAAVGRTAEDGGPHPLDLDRLEYNDARVFSMFQRADTTGVFQFESGGMRRLLTEMQPDRLEDLIAANALFRPGPMDLIPDYNRRKHGQDSVPQVHPIVDRFTAPTYGVMVYQEQVMQIVHELGGIPLRAAYGLIKAIGKKKAKIIDGERPKFVEGAQKQGLSKEKAEELFELILKFAGYGFNKSHSTGYAIVAYQTAYLKTYYPRQYMAAFLTFESQAQKVSDWIPYLEDCRRTKTIDPVSGKTLSVGVEVRAPSINSSGSVFEVVYDPGEQKLASAGHIRFGMSAIKGVGTRAIESIIIERTENGPFRSLYDFCERCVARCGGLVNKGVVDALIKSGCFDVVHQRQARASLTATIDRALSAGQKAAADKAAGQGALFGGMSEPQAASESTASTPLVAAEAWSEAETLKQEKETLGFYVSSHPLESWSSWAGLFTTHDVNAARQLTQDTRVTLAVIVQSVRTIVLKQGKSVGRKMAIVTIEDLGGTMDAVLFAECYGSYGHLLEGDEPFFVLGRIDLKRGDPQVVVDALAPISGVPRRGGSLRLVLSEPRLNGGANRALAELADALSEQPVKGSMPEEKMPAVPLQVWVETDLMRCEIEPKRFTTVRLVPETARRLCAALGPGSAKLVGGASIEEPQRPKWQKRGGGGGGDEE
jgi:DNA polymerase III subunit alpha